MFCHVLFPKLCHPLSSPDLVLCLKFVQRYSNSWHSACFGQSGPHIAGKKQDQKFVMLRNDLKVPFLWLRKSVCFLLFKTYHTVSNGLLSSYLYSYAIQILIVRLWYSCLNYAPSIQRQLGHSSYKSQPAMVFFFQAGILFCIANAKFWPILSNLGYFVTNLRTFCCTFYRPN